MPTIRPCCPTPAGLQPRKRRAKLHCVYVQIRPICVPGFLCAHPIRPRCPTPSSRPTKEGQNYIVSTVRLGLFVSRDFCVSVQRAYYNNHNILGLLPIPELERGTRVMSERAVASTRVMSRAFSATQRAVARRARPQTNHLTTMAQAT